MPPPHARPLPPDAPKLPLRRATRMLRRVLALARPEWPRLALATCFLAIGSAATLAFPQAIRMLVDGALAGAGHAGLDRAALVLAVVFLVQGVATTLRYVLFSISGERIVTRLRKDLYRHLLSQEVGFFDAQRTGDLANRLASDTTVLQTAVSANISMSLRNGAAVLGGIALLLWTSPVLTALMLSVVPPVALGAVWYGRRVRRLSRDVQDALAAGAAVAEESLSGIRTVRTFAAEPVEAARYSEAMERSFALARRRSVLAGTFMGAASFAALGSSAVVLWYGGRLVAAGSMSVGALTSFLIYTLVVASSLGALADLWAEFMRAAGAAERVFELLDRRPALASGGRTLARVEGRIELAGVTFSYPSRRGVRALSEVSFRAEPGEVVALVGPSGAGKSTLASLLVRLYDPDEGAVRLDGHDLRVLDPDWLRRHVGVVAQEPLLFSTSIAENIRYGRADATDAQVEEAARAANAHDFIRAFPDGYRTLVGERGVQLSGGQKQRVAIARAVLKDPKLLVLDEATSALDAESEHLVREALERLLRGRTTLVIAHRLSTVAHADRLVVLEGGRVVEQGTHATLMDAAGLYKRLVERQFVVA